ncbi:MAG: cytidylate kinase-like family protein [Deltaproteobacteria bacterium]
MKHGRIKMSTSPFIITISRQLGSGGAYIGQQLAVKLNILYADREIIQQAAKKLAVQEEMLERRDEKLSSFWKSFLRSYAFGNPDVYVPQKNNMPTSRELFEAETEAVTRIARECSAVIIGRSGSYVLRDHPNHVSLFIHGDLPSRKSRVQETQQVSEEAAAKMIDQSDKERALYHRTFTGREWADARRYHLAIDTGRMDLDKSVEVILKYVECRQATPGGAP